MSEAEDWLPELLLFNEDANGIWNDYVDLVYTVFRDSFITSQPKFMNKWVRCRRDPLTQGREAGFWHCISEGKDEINRTPDIRRCERIKWVRAILDHIEDDRIDVWVIKDHSDLRHAIWFDECYLIILAERGRLVDGSSRYYQLITAYCTEQEHRKQKLRIQRDNSKNV